MKQKTLNKIAKYCKSEDMRFGQLIDILVMEWPVTQSEVGYALHAITDDKLEKNFNQFIKSFPPTKKDRGGYFPHGHLPTMRDGTPAPSSKPV